MRPSTRVAAHRARLLALLLIVGMVADIGSIIEAPATASGETGTGTSSCAVSTPPNRMTLVAGTPQTTTLDTAFATGLEVALTNSDGCAVTDAAGVAVTFSAPTSGPSGVFSGSGSNSVTVGSDSSGAAAAPSFTADDIAGSYTVTATSPYGSVAFSLTNTATGVPARIIAMPPASRTARVASRYARPLQVQVLDSSGNPVAGTTVSFTLGTGGASRCGVSALAGASFAGGGTQAAATTDASGVASSPSFIANNASGTFTATAAISSPGSGSGSEKTSAGNTTPASFTLSNLAGNPAKLTPGLGATQSTRVGTRFAIVLAVTVTDAEKNPVRGASVTFAAPARGPSGRFTTRSRGSRHRRSHTSRRRAVTVKTDTCGIALAPPFTATDRRGGYIVKATAPHARAAAFALVNAGPGPAP
jgi:protocatechuate 3,4-dioxygenase beta subunit